MRPKDLLERARRMLADRGSLSGVVHLHYEDAEDMDSSWKTVDMKDYPPGPDREALMEGACVMTGRQEDWVELMLREDEEEARRAKS